MKLPLEGDGDRDRLGEEGEWASVGVLRRSGEGPKVGVRLTSGECPRVGVLEARGVLTAVVEDLLTGVEEEDSSRCRLCRGLPLIVFWPISAIPGRARGVLL